MNLKENIYYWKISLENPEQVGDEYYIHDEIIIEDENFIKIVERLRELIVSYCEIIEKDKNSASKILDEIYSIIINQDKIQYTEFVAFWKVLDISYSAFKKLPNKRFILEGLLQKYCERRHKLYNKIGNSNIIIQALYDSGVSRKKGTSGIVKLIDLIKKILGNIPHVKNLDTLRKIPAGYFLPDKGDKKLFKEFCNTFNIQYKFGKEHQEKEPDMVLKVKDHFFIIEAKHIKETGGAQNKQINEVIEFIKYTENSNKIHYLSFMDGIYFNNFIWINNKNSKINIQKKAIENHLTKNKNNFFVNTTGLKTLLKDLAKEIKNKKKE